MRFPIWMSLVALASAIGLSGGCNEEQAARDGGSSTAESHVAHVTVPSGTSLDVTLGTPLSSESAGVGDAWSGSILNGRDGIPAGSEVRGTVRAVTAARKGNRAMLDLTLSSVTIGDRRYPVHAGMEAITAGSPRARNLGAIAGSAAAGALIGGAMGGGKGALIGGAVGGGAATGVVSKSKGWQVVLKSGTPLTFTTRQALAVRS